MKYIPIVLRLLVCFLVSFSLQAQIVIEPSDVAEVGDQVVYKVSFDSTLTAGSAGDTTNGMYYNFSMLPGLGQGNLLQTDTITAVNPAGLPGGASFSTSNIALEGGLAGQNVFCSKTSSDFLVQGLVVNVPIDSLNLGGINIPSTIVARLNPAFSYIKFPSQFGNIFTSNSSFRYTIPFDTTIVYNGFSVNIDSARLVLFMTINSHIDGLKYLQLPYLPEELCLRQKYTISTDVEVQLGGNVPFFGFTWVTVPLPVQLPNLNYQSYRYWVKNGKYPQAEVVMDSAGTTAVQISYRAGTPPTAVVPKLSSVPVVAYPVPASDLLGFKGVKQPSKVVLFDQTGKAVKKIKIENEAPIKINLAKGLYFYTLSPISQPTDVQSGKFLVQ